MPVTDRLSDKNLIELAKQQYENKQKSTVPSVLVTFEDPASQAQAI